MTRILIADDVSENRYLLSALFRGSGYEVVARATPTRRSSTTASRGRARASWPSPSRQPNSRGRFGRRWTPPRTRGLIRVPLRRTLMHEVGMTQMSRFAVQVGRIERLGGLGSRRHGDCSPVVPAPFARRWFESDVGRPAPSLRASRRIGLLVTPQRASILATSEGEQHAKVGTTLGAGSCR